MIPGLLLTGAALAGGLELGLEQQAYPAGLISAPTLGLVVGEQHLLRLTAATNLTSRRDWGEHDDERGLGGGPGLSWTTYLQPTRTGPFLSARVDLWFLGIDWEDARQGVVETGHSDIVVVQPTARLGWAFGLGDQARWRLEPTLGLGLEVNVATAGEPVGQGAILLLGLGLHRVL